MYRIKLNTAIRDNYAFFCPDTRLHLTLTNPVGNADRVSPAIERGIKAKTLIDIDGLLTKNGDAEPKQPVQDQKGETPESQKEQSVEDPKSEQEMEQPSQEQKGDIFSQLEEAGVPVEPEKEEKKPAKKNNKTKTAKAVE